MRQADFAWGRRRAAADEPRFADRVVRFAERTRRDERLSLQLADRAVDFRRFERFFEGHRGKNRRQTLGEHRFSRAGGTEHEDVVSSRRGNRHRAFRRFLTMYFRKVDVVFRMSFKLVSRQTGSWINIQASLEKTDGFGEGFDRNRVDSVDQSGFGGVFLRHENTAQPRFFCARTPRQGRA